MEKSDVPDTSRSAAPVPVPAPAQGDSPKAAQVLEHVTGAHQQLKTLRDRLGILDKHPELEAALTQLELALSALSVSTGGMW